MSSTASDRNSLWIRIVAALLTLVFAIGAFGQDPHASSDRAADGVSSSVSDGGSGTAAPPLLAAVPGWSLYVLERPGTARMHTFTPTDAPTVAAVLEVAPKLPPPVRRPA